MLGGPEETVNDVLLHHLPVEKAVIAGTPDLLPANIDLAGADTVLLTKTAASTPSKGHSGTSRVPTITS